MSEADCLDRMLGAYFDLAWAAEGGAAEARLSEMLSEVPVELQKCGAREIAKLLGGGLCENQIRDALLYEIGCHYAFERDGFEASSWLRHVQDRIVENTTADLEVVPAAEADLPAVMMLVRRCIEEMRRRGIDQWDDIYPGRTRFAEDVNAGSLWIASSHGADLVGVFTLDEHQDVEYADVPWRFEGPPVAVVHRLMVDPGVQGRGIARRLMRFAEERAIRLGYGVLRLDAFTRNPYALRLYRSLGYRYAGEVTFRKGRFRCFEKRLRDGP
ncbi:MAG: GNAT family N-acetyltransferase [Gemmatimonadota bacterium]|jgi:GNAT superfamily N-acetyltransferase